MPTVLITGGHSGIGRECSRYLASHFAADLVLAGRDLTALEAFAAQVRAEHGVKVTALQMDVSSLSSVRAGAAELASLVRSGQVEPLQALIANAGAQFRGAGRYSPEGYELTFATNCLGHFLLLDLTRELLTDDARVVFTASGTHDPETVDGKMVGKALTPDAVALAHAGQGKHPLPSFGKRYSTAKLCVVMYAYELDRRLRATGSARSSTAFDPGSVPETGLLRTMPAPAQRIARTRGVKWAMKRAGVTSSTAAFAGQSLARTALDPALADTSGTYLQCKDGTLSPARSSTVSYDEGLARELWSSSQQLVA